MGLTTELLEQGRYGTVRRTVLPSGLRVVTEEVPGVRSASVGIYADVGSRDETPELAGASHFLEHVLFKGTKRRSALQISAEVEAVGGDSNAYTSKEHTCFHTQVLERDLPLAVDVLCDMITCSVIDEREFNTERGVIFEEIAAGEDEPADIAAELFDEAALGTHPLARPILGTNDSIAAMTRDAVFGFYQSHYVPQRLVVAAAGRLEHDTFVQLVAEGFATGELNVTTGQNNLRDRRQLAPSQPAADCTAQRIKDTEQAHLTLGVLGVSRHDERRYAVAVLSQILGGGMSSRLFQEVRERRGLAYAVSAFVNCYDDIGFLGIYAGCSPAKLAELTDVVMTELSLAARSGVSAAELARAKGMISGATVLDTEDTASRMSRIGHRELYFFDYASVDDYLGKIATVTLHDVGQVAEQLLIEPYIVGLVGPTSLKG